MRKWKIKINPKTFLVLFLQILLIEPLLAQESPTPPEGYELAWAEEFDKAGKPNPKFLRGSFCIIQPKRQC